MRRYVLAVALGLGVSAWARDGAPSVALETSLLGDGLWSVTPEQAETAWKPLGFQWVSAAKDTLRAAHPGLTLGTYPVNEVVVSFADGAPKAFKILYYNRGDAGDLREDQFNALLAGVTEDLTRRTGKKPAERARDVGSAVRAEGLVWTTPDAEYALDWSVTKGSRVKSIPFRAEFIRLVVERPGAAEARDSGSRRNRDAMRAFRGTDHVRRDGGTVAIASVPMVDQGEKGYCVVATVERVMRYFGASVDQHELAQIANTSTDGGTSVSAMMDSLKRLTARLGVRTKEIIAFQPAEFLKTVSDYNRAAKRGNRAMELKASMDIDEYYSGVQYDLWKEVRLKQKADFGRFEREVQRSIAEGIPLLWSVRLGLVPEKGINPQVQGGHMRLIIGYDTTTREILYTDSWGSGHEQKRMAADDAFAITQALGVLEPISS